MAYEIKKCIVVIVKIQSKNYTFEFEGLECS